MRSAPTPALYCEMIAARKFATGLFWSPALMENGGFTTQRSQPSAPSRSSCMSPYSSWIIVAVSPMNTISSSSRSSTMAFFCSRLRAGRFVPGSVSAASSTSFR